MGNFVERLPLLFQRLHHVVVQKLAESDQPEGHPRGGGVNYFRIKHQHKCVFVRITYATLP
eukprot:6070445-Pyramimonas_sp.AAC.1